MIEDWNDFAHSTRGLLIGCAGMFLLAVALMFATGEWSAYTHEYASGVRFAPQGEDGCGIELPTREGRELGMTVLYCDGQDKASYLPAAIYTNYGSK